MIKCKYYIIRLITDPHQNKNTPVGILVYNDTDKTPWKKLINTYDWPKNLDRQHEAACQILDYTLSGNLDCLKVIKSPFKYTGPFIKSGDNENSILHDLFAGIVIK